MAKLNIRQRERTKQPVRKSISDRRVFVVKDGVRKARSIKKFQDTYYVGLAYVGLAELTLSNDEPDWQGGGKRIHKRSWEANLSAETPYGVDVDVYVNIDSNQSTWDSPERAVNDFPSSVRNEFGYYTNLNEVQRENMVGVTENEFTFDLWYSISDATKQGRSKDCFKKMEVGPYYSMEDCLDAISQLSEEAWGNVTIALKDYQEKYSEYMSGEANYPDTISLQLPTGDTLVLDKKDNYDRFHEGNWSGKWIFADDNANIKAVTEVTIQAVVMDDGRYTDSSADDFMNRYYSADRGKTPEYYAVRVSGRIFDNNTQTESSRSFNDNPDSWVRLFEGEGADTLEGAIAIAESNISEVYQEFKAFVESERNYETVGHGQGYRRTTENTEPWEYNFGDTYDDVAYDKWQSYDEYNPETPVSVTGTEWDEMNYWSSLDNDAKIFSEEYLGTYLAGAMKYDYDRADNKLYFTVSNWSIDGAKRREIMEQKTRDDVERVANYMGLKLVDYTDPLNFVLSKGVKKRVRKSKMPYAYYDVEVRNLQRQGLVKSKQAQPKSFNDMVKSIRAKNNQHKRRV